MHFKMAAECFVNTLVSGTTGDHLSLPCYHIPMEYLHCNA